MKPEKVLEEIEAMVGIQRIIQRIKMGKKPSKKTQANKSKIKLIHAPVIGPERGKILVKVIKEHRPKRILEVGTYVGYSAILIAIHIPKNAKVITCEINAKIGKIAEKFIQKAGFQDKIEIKIGDAIKIIPELKGPFDLLFLDAKKEEYLDYLRITEPKLSKDAYILADNVRSSKEKMSDYLDYVRKSGRYESEMVSFTSDAVEVSKRIY